jgi:hypothetical protein
MGAKSLFDLVGDADLPPIAVEEYQVYFQSLQRFCDPVQRWMEQNLGPVEHHGTFRFLEFEKFGVKVGARLIPNEAGDKCAVEWRVGYAGRSARVGWTEDGADLDTKIPPAVLLAVAFVELRSREEAKGGK